MGLSSRSTAIIVLFLVFFGGIALILSLPRTGEEPENALENGVTHTQILPEESGEEAPGVEGEVINPGYYTLFSLNVHDWTHPDESVATVEHVLDIHEEYGVPVDIYFTDPLFRMTVEKDPELIERLKNSSVATVAYHIRPPVPYYPDFDWFGLSTLSDDDLYSTLYAYETHALDLETGMYTEAPGGYAYVKDVIGYAPLSVGILPGGRIGDVLGHVYADLGGTFVVTHRQERVALGEEVGSTGLYYRPEDEDVKIYEEARRTQDGGAVLEAYFTNDAPQEAIFLGVKYHDDNFFTIGGTPWWPVYFSSDEKEKQETDPLVRTPPFPLGEAGSAGRLETDVEQAQDWELYESAVKYVAEHPEKVTPLNLILLKNLFQEE